MSRPSPVPDWSGLREDLLALHRVALAAADPAAAVRRALRLRPAGLVIGDTLLRMAADTAVRLVALGKASPAMARAALSVLGQRVAGGVVAHPRGLDPGSGWPPSVELVPGGHPLPDEGSLRAGASVLRLLRRPRPQDIVLVLLSGGGSALLEALPPGVTLEDLREVTRALQLAGADIAELNTVRRALSLFKGGRLARLAQPARVASLVLSDVPGDPLEAIASGPTLPSPTGPGDALAVLERYGLAAAHGRVVSRMRTRSGHEEESAGGSPQRSHPKGAEAAAGDSAPRIHLGSDESAEDNPRVVHAVIGSNEQALAAVRREARRRGFRPLILTACLQGEAREVGKVAGGLAQSVRRRSLPIAPPACLVLGGETTVTVRGGGLGGRNPEIALGAALVLEGCPRSAVFSFATDGVDGPTDAAGAVATGETLARAAAMGLSARAALAANDSQPFFAALGDLWVTGPTGTNVNDLTLVLVYP